MASIIADRTSWPSLTTLQRNTGMATCERGQGDGRIGSGRTACGAWKSRQRVRGSSTYVLGVISTGSNGELVHGLNSTSSNGEPQLVQGVNSTGSRIELKREPRTRTNEQHSVNNNGHKKATDLCEWGRERNRKWWPRSCRPWHPASSKRWRQARRILNLFPGAASKRRPMRFARFDGGASRFHVRSPSGGSLRRPRAYERSVPSKARPKNSLHETLGLAPADRAKIIAAAACGRPEQDDEAYREGLYRALDAICAARMESTLVGNRSAA